MKAKTNHKIYTLILVFTILLSACNTQQFKNDHQQKSKIAFHSDRDGNAEIYTIDADGNNELKLTENPSDDRFPSWSPDGSKILFQSDREGEQYIFVMNCNGSDVRKIPNTKDGNYAKWSKDGKKIAFFAEREGNSEIIVINPDGSEPLNLSSHTSTDETPSWSHDGNTISFQTNRGAIPDPEIPEEEQRLNFGIYIMNTDGSEQREVTGFDTNDENPSISPDGSQIVYQSYIQDGLAIVVINSDGSGKKVLTVADPPCGSPAWSGDGKKIAFDSMRDGNFEIYSMNTDGSEQKQLTHTQDCENSGASWTLF